jgi:hypothetical protein
MSGASLLRVKKLQPEIVAGWCPRKAAASDFAIAPAARSTVSDFGVADSCALKAPYAKSRVEMRAPLSIAVPCLEMNE